MMLVLIDSKLFPEILSMSFHICQEMKNESFKRRHCKEWERTTLPVRNEQRCCIAAECLQEALQKSCKSAGLQQPQILAAVESPLTAINSAFAAVQKIPESRSALQSGCKVASKRQRMLLPVTAYHSLAQKKEMQAPIIQ